MQGPVGEGGGCLVVPGGGGGGIGAGLGGKCARCSSVLEGALRAEGSKALIPVVKKFMKTCPVIEMAGVQRGPAGAQLCDWEIVRLGCEQSSLATDELYLIRWCLLTSLSEKGPRGIIFIHLTLMTSTVS